LRELVQVSYVKVSEYQQRGLVHLHVAIRHLPAFVAAAHGHAYRRRDGECVLFAWMSCEQLLDYFWQDHVLRRALDGAHRKRLEDGRTFSAAVQAEGLRLMGLMRDRTYELVSRARKQRNDLVYFPRINA